MTDTPIQVQKAQPHAFAADLLTAPAPAERIAILVCHGMGQQVPFETLDTVARALSEAQARANSGAVPTASVPIKTGIVQLQQTQMARAELQLEGKSEIKHVHIYEAYWAPLTEGKVTLRDVYLFLWNAAKNGLRDRLKEEGAFKRWIFEGWKEFRIKSWRICLIFAVGLAVLWALAIINGTIAAVSASQVLTTAVPVWPSKALLADLTVDLALLNGVLLLTAAVFAIVLVTRNAGATNRSSGGRKLVVNTFVWGSTVAIVAAGAFVLFHLIRHRSGIGPLYWPNWLNRMVIANANPADPVLRHLVIIGVWALTVFLTFNIRWFLVQFVGDVAAYVSAHAVNRFYEIRRAIQDVGLKAARVIYSEKDYHSVILVGHSLGSVVAYDTLNAMILEDQLSNNSGNVVMRTKLLLTFGSPLDKTAFIFRTQRSREQVVREALAAAVQPMIVSYENRPKRWINIWTPNDWISGKLDYYDNPDDPTAGGTKRVDNLVDPAADIPLAAHTQYWRNNLFADKLYEALIT